MGTAGNDGAQPAMTAWRAVAGRAAGRVIQPHSRDRPDRNGRRQHLRRIVASQGQPSELSHAPRTSVCSAQPADSVKSRVSRMQKPLVRHRRDKFTLVGRIIDSRANHFRPCGFEVSRGGQKAAGKAKRQRNQDAAIIRQPQRGSDGLTSNRRQERRPPRPTWPPGIAAADASGAGCGAGGMRRSPGEPQSTTPQPAAGR